MEVNDENIEYNQNIERHVEEEIPVKSKAVVKFSQVEVPVKFNRLQCNTNLNLPPSNWLTSADSSYGLNQALYHTSGFASFRMAHMFPDCVGEVDVVADAENIKKLLKLPYVSKGAISMTVHKVGNTLLLDEFDVQKYLLRKADDDWQWLRTFILEQILSYGDSGHNLCLKDKSREAIQTKNLLSKFLYYSLKQTSSHSEENFQPENLAKNSKSALPLSAPLLPEPKVEENVPDPNSSHNFQRNVVWTFEDIRMLIGTDMPIFGGPNRPCISLRLRDMEKPINVLTGIDYWLDNLMCNVPEVVMCYHIDGIVQKYEIIKTEDLPYLENSQFSPQVVRNVAQNILAFLKANATKEGHTYWLFKARNDDVVKLYDLTTLCKSQSSSDSTKSNANDREEAEGEEKQGNPFTVPVGMLLYTVARNMKNHTPQISAKTAGNIRALLDNCIKLLPEEKYPQIVTSSHYILSDLHIPAGIDPKDPKFDVNDNDSDTNSVYEDDDDYDEEAAQNNDDSLNFQELLQEQNVAVQNICDTLKDFHFDGQRNGKNLKHRPAPLIATTEERCSIALQHIGQGLKCLKFFNKNEETFIKETEERAKDEEKQKILHEELNPNMAKPFKPIPLPYESLRGQQKLLTHCSSLDSDNDGELKSADIDSSSNKKKKKLRKSHSRDDKSIIPTVPSSPVRHQIAANFNSQLFGSWNAHLKLLLLEKACLTYATLAEYHYVCENYGSSLRAIYMSCKCQQVVLKYMSTMISQKSCLIGRAGDCFFQMSKNWQNIKQYLKEFDKGSELEEPIQNVLDKEIDSEDCSELILPQENVELLMASSCACYEMALEHINNPGDANKQESRNELLKRLGNVRNELGLKYMFWSQEECSKMIQENNLNPTQEDITTDPIIEDNQSSEEILPSKTDDPLYIKLAMKSYDSLMRGIQAFTLVQDNINMAFLYCNMGRFMRFRAHLTIPNENLNAMQQLRRFYNEAFTYYEKAHDILGSRKSNAELWDLVNWELSTATFTLAKQLQDYSTADEISSADLEKEVLDRLQKSLKLCDVEHPGARQILYTYRSGLIHKRIASFHYSQLRNTCSDAASIPKTTLQLCKYHYEKAASILDSLRESSDYLIVQLERISLQEFLTEVSNNNSQKIKHLQQALEICLSSKDLLAYSIANNISTGGSDAVQSTSNELEFIKHIQLFESRLQFILKTLIKLLMSGKDPKQKAQLYKKMYMETLNIRKVTGEQQAKNSAECKVNRNSGAVGGIGSGGDGGGGGTTGDNSNSLAPQFAKLLEKLIQVQLSYTNSHNNINS